MNLGDDACYRALESKDGRFDGLFFVGVASTGIYCRCVCTARTPKRANCTFYENAAAAEKAGYRPCLICRPEIAPGRSRVDAVGLLANSAVRLIEDGALSEMNLTELAAELGVSDRHLRRSVVEQFGVSPVELAQTQRLLAAKRLLTDTRLPVGEVAFASGFGSLRRFNAVFRERYRMNPSDLRRRTPLAGESLCCEIAFRPPYDWDAMVGFLGARTVKGVESIIDGRYVRAACLGKHRGWLAVSPSPTKNTLRVEIAASLATVLPQLLRRVRHLFDTAADPTAITLALGDLGSNRPGLRVPGAFDGFEIAVRAVLGQQVSVVAARTMAGRVAERFGEPVETPFSEIRYAFPSASRIAEIDPSAFGELGVIRTRSAAIVEISTRVQTRQIRLAPGADPEQTRQSLKSISGVGEWTAQYVAMRALGYPDAFPNGDLGILKALGTTSPNAALEMAEQWRPWRAYAAMHLWKSLENQP